MEDKPRGEYREEHFLCAELRSGSNLQNQNPEIKSDFKYINNSR